MSSGHTSGLTVDVGEGLQQVTAIYDGYAINDIVRHQRLGGQDVTNLLLEGLKNHGMKLSSSFYPDYFTTRDIKESVSFVSPTPLRNLPSSDSHLNYRLPDGTTIEISDMELMTCQEVLFDPKIRGKEGGHQHVVLKKGLKQK